MEKISKRLTQYVIYKRMVNEEDRVLYEYGFRIAMEVSVFVVFCLILMIKLHMFIDGMLFFIIFIPLRSYAGGLHLEKYYSCLILSCLTFLGILMIVKHIQIPMKISLVVLCILLFLIYILHPIENMNRVVDREENKYFKMKLKKVILIDMIIAVVCMISKKDSKLFLITSTLTVVVITMLIGKCKNKYTHYNSSKI